MKKITAKWTSSDPCLCNREWHITIDGVEIELPEWKKNDHMDTYGTYYRWYSNDNGYNELFSYTDGLTFDPWVDANPWVKELNLTLEEERALFKAISDEDWRYEDCGACS